VWAATVITLLSHPFNESPPHEILSEIVGSRRQVGGSDGLGELYGNALRRLFPTSDAQKHFRRFMGAIIVLQEPLSLFDFSMLTGIPSHLINKILFALSALQMRSPPSGSERMIHPATILFHLSFLEYVQAKTTETSFATSAFDSHATVGLSCLHQLACLPSPCPHHNFRLRAIQHYVVKYWPYHVSNGTLCPSNQWSQTEHCLALQTISFGAQRRWAAFFYRTLMPGGVGLVLEADDGLGKILMKLANRLGRSGGDHWGFQVACLEVAVRIDEGDAEAWSELGCCYRARGKRMGGIQMHEEALAAFRCALQLQPESHPNHADSLDNVAIALWSCYQLNGNQDTLNEMILYAHKALMLCPAPHPDRDNHLNTLAIAIALTDLYNHNGDLQTLKGVISLHREALELRPTPHPERSQTLNNLALALQNFHRHNGGDIDALNEAISLHHEALALCPTHPDRSTSLGNRANALDELSRSNGDDEALNKAISLYHEALALRPEPHPGRSGTLTNLANSLKARYHRSGDISTLNECISLYREALGLCPAPHPNRSQSLDNLAYVLLSQFEQNREVEVLDEAISLRRELLILRPSGHRYRAADLQDILHLLETRQEVTGDDRDRGEIDDLEAELATLDDECEDSKDADSDSDS
jgi:tetratricopeptide (TPR) repeat protein